MMQMQRVASILTCTALCLIETTSANPTQSASGFTCCEYVSVWGEETYNGSTWWEFTYGSEDQTLGSIGIYQRLGEVNSRVLYREIDRANNNYSLTFDWSLHYVSTQRAWTLNRLNASATSIGDAWVYSEALCPSNVSETWIVTSRVCNASRSECGLSQNRPWPSFRVECLSLSPSCAPTELPSTRAPALHVPLTNAPTAEPSIFPTDPCSDSDICDLLGPSSCSVDIAVRLECPLMCRTGCSTTVPSAVSSTSVPSVFPSVFPTTFPSSTPSTSPSVLESWNTLSSTVQASSTIMSLPSQSPSTSPTLFPTITDIAADTIDGNDADTLVYIAVGILCGCGLIVVVVILTRRRSRCSKSYDVQNAENNNPTFNLSLPEYASMEEPLDNDVYEIPNTESLEKYDSLNGGHTRYAEVSTATTANGASNYASLDDSREAYASDAWQLDYRVPVTAEERYENVPSHTTST